MSAGGMPLSRFPFRFTRNQIVSKAMTVTRAANLMSRSRRDPVEIGLLVLGVVVMVVVLVVNTVAFTPSPEQSTSEGDAVPPVAARAPVEPDVQRFERSFGPMMGEWQIAIRSRHAAVEGAHPKLPTRPGSLEQEETARVYTFERLLERTGETSGSRPERTEWTPTPRTPAVDQTPSAPTTDSIAVQPNDEDPIAATGFWYDLVFGAQRWFPGVGSLIERFMASI